MSGGVFPARTVQDNELPNLFRRRFGLFKMPRFGRSSGNLEKMPAVPRVDEDSTSPFPEFYRATWGRADKGPGPTVERTLLAQGSECGA